jgi:hypothetical protein
MVYRRRKKRGGTGSSPKGVVDVPALQSYASAGNPSTSAADAVSTSAQQQNSLNGALAGGGGCSRSSKISVVTFPSSSASPVDASSNASQITQTLAQAQTDNKGDTVGGSKARRSRKAGSSCKLPGKSGPDQCKGGARRSHQVARRSRQVARRSKARRSKARRTRRRKGGNWGCLS